MKTRIILIICVLLAFCFVMGACTTGETPSIEDTTETDTTVQEDTNDQTTTEQQTEQQTEQPTEQETEPPVEVLVPDGEYPDLTALLAGESDVIDMVTDARGKTVSQMKSGGKLTFVVGSLFAKSDDGLKADNSGWDSVGYSQPISTDTYTAKAKFSVAANDRGGSFNAAMVGLYCKTAQNLFIDGGLWFSFRENQVAVYVEQGFEKTLATNLPFSAEDGIQFRADGDTSGASIYANDVLIAMVEIGEQLTVKSANGNTVATCDLTNVAVDGSGYFRYMSHYANSTLSEMSICGKTERAYVPCDQVYSFMQDVSYGFVDKAQYLSALPATVYAELVYADARMLADMFGFACESDQQKLVMQRDGVTLTFSARQTGVDLNGQAYAFPTTVYTKGTYMLPVEAFAQMIGYDVQSQGTLTIAALSTKIQEGIQMAEERFELYKNVIYNYEDVECDQTGVGKYEATPFEERVVGIAYSPWHTAGRNWKTGTWDTPLYGPYLSEDEAVLRYHAELLRDAGVDFVFVDWSNNTNYDPATMRDQREDFRMIEEATDKMFDVWATVEGAPKICIFVGPGHTGIESVKNGNHQKKVDQVWRDYVTNESRADMYFYYQGKPLLICYGATPTQYTGTPQNKWHDDRYTVRWMTGYVGQQSGLFQARTLQSKGYWSWEERGAQTYTVLNGRVEAVTVSAATRQQGKVGESGYIPAAGRENGATLKRQFQRACDLGAGVVLIVSWNEWTTGEQPSAEISKDMEPSVIHGTFYYDLMREQIRKFKGQIPTQE